LIEDSAYDRAFYEFNVIDSRRSGEAVLPHVLDLISGIRSAVDVGCGTGVWLSILKEKGVATIQGYDGEWVLSAEALAIPRECFQPVDLNRPWDIGRRYDLAISVEVAEHLQPASSPAFVHSLARLSDIVLFSAAVPGQGGDHHINERWPTYWAELFRNEGYEVVDVLRGMIWDDARIGYWYRQNLLLFLNRATKADLIATLQRRIKPPICLIHPELYAFKNRFVLFDIMDADVSAKQAFKLFLSRTKRAIQRRLQPGKS
jgi:hypothetical protein